MSRPFKQVYYFIIKPLTYLFILIIIIIIVYHIHLINYLFQGTLMAVGDQLAQNLVEKRQLKDLDFLRTAQFYAIGFCFGVNNLIIFI